MQLASVTIPKSVTRIGDNAFYYCGGLTSVTIGNGVTTIGGYAFCYCSSLSKLTIGNSVTTIGYAAFSVCPSLTNLTIPDSVTTIGGLAFDACTSLTNVTIGNGVTTLDSAQFYMCGALTSVTMGNSLTNIGGDGGYYGGYTFAYCTNLTGIYFQGNAPSIVASVFYNGNLPTLYYLPGTTGWGATLDGCPTTLWRPQILTADAMFGVRTNQFGFTVAWASGQSIVVEASTTLGDSWVPVRSASLTNGLFYFGDPSWTNWPARIYRIRSP